jgi:hypothetical protein
LGVIFLKKSFTVILFILFSSLFFTACSSGKVKSGNQTIYSTKITKIKATSDGDWIVSGSTSAPDGTKIIAVSATSSYKENASATSDPYKWPKAKNGKFKMHVDAITAVDGTAYKKGKKVKVDIMGLSNYKKNNNSEVPSKIIKDFKKSFEAYTLTLTAKQVSYINSLDDDSDSSSDDSSYDDSTVDDNSSSSDSYESDVNDYSDSSSASSSSMDYQSVTFDQLARTPDNYEAKGVKVQGQVMQVQNSKKSTVVLLWMNDDSDSLVMIEIGKSYLPANGNILEDDEITVNGLGSGTQKYETTNGDENEVPLIFASDTVVDNGKSANAY